MLQQLKIAFSVINQAFVPFQYEKPASISFWKLVEKEIYSHIFGRHISQYNMDTKSKNDQKLKSREGPALRRNHAVILSEVSVILSNF